MAAGKRVNKRLIPGIGWVRPKQGYCWTISGKGIRKINLPAWGSRRYPIEWGRIRKWRITPMSGRFILSLWGLSYTGCLWPDIASAMDAIAHVERSA